MTLIVSLMCLRGFWRDNWKSCRALFAFALCMRGFVLLHFVSWGLSGRPLGFEPHTGGQ